MSEHKYIGKSTPRRDTRLKATGEAKFTADLGLPNMLHAAVLRSPHPHARILRLDTSRAAARPGVKAVVTAADSSGVKWGVFRYTRDQEFMARDKVRYIGEEIAGVAAETEEIAREALGLIEVEYEPLPAVFDPLSAIAEGAPLVHDHAPGNINIHVPIAVGDVESALAECDYVHQETTRSEEESYFTTEPYAVLVHCDRQGTVEVWMPNASPHTKAKGLANALELPVSKVHVRHVWVGGAFGGRSDMFPGEYIAALLSRKTRRPIRLVYTREENSIAIRQGHSMVVESTFGFKRNGTLHVADVTAHMDGGAYSSTGPIATSVPFLCFEQTYRVPHVRYNGYRVYTNKPIRGMIRTHGRAWACNVDMQLDLAATALGLDPVEIRRINALTGGETTPTQSYIPSMASLETVEAVAKASRFQEKWGKLPRWRGIGIGSVSVMSGFPMGIRGGSAAIVKFDEDGGATVISGVVDNGQGNENMVLQVAAESLRLPVEQLQLTASDTEITPIDQGAYSQATTLGSGNAVRNACEDAKRQIFEIASVMMESAVEDLEMDDGQVFVRGSRDRGLRLSKVIRTGLLQGKAVIGHGSWGPNVDQTREWISNPKGQFAAAFSYGSAVVEVEVDPETGQVDVLDVWASHDCGRAINPAEVEGQMDGGVAMGGHGGILLEACKWHQGANLNTNFLDYKVPLAPDMPPIHNFIVEADDPTGPFGAKEGGLSISMCTAQAYTNAIANAIGSYIHEFPFTPDRILAAIEKGRAS
ncbi:MAG TPA: xanthine dehydrogenase family protein molybdopterin-binding subunit [Deferrisomatales bacterium]|nr:xanthine dehydrogenase family protein molybdopterin-binding subunit [Deferrisomatales bacterium]